MAPAGGMVDHRSMADRCPHAPSRGLTALTLALVASALVVVAVLPWARPTDLGRWLFVVGAVAGLETFPVVGVRPGAALRFNLTEAGVVLAAATLGRSEAVAAMLAAGALVTVGHLARGSCWHKSVFAGGVVAVVSSAVIWPLGAPTGIETVGAVAALAGAAGVYALVTVPLAALAAHLAAGRTLRTVRPPLTLHHLRTTALAVVLGLIAIGVSDSAWLLWVTGVAGAALVASGMRLDQAALQRDRSAALLHASERLNAVNDRDELDAVLLDAAEVISGGAVRFGTDPAPWERAIDMPEQFGIQSLLIDAAARRRGDADPAPVVGALLAMAAGALDNLILRAQLGALARTDELTRLPNRRAFTEALEAAAARAARGEPFGVLFIDLDGLKRINDEHDHAVGDLVLREVASRLLRSVRAADGVFRLAGDEFTVLAAGVRRAADLAVLAAAVEHRVSGLATVHGVDVVIGVTVGGAIWGVDGTSTDELLRVADQRMYETKRARFIA